MKEFKPETKKQNKPIQETQPIDFLDENLSVSFSIDKKAIENLPEITENDLETKREQYRIFLGETTISVSGSVKIIINGILEIPEGPHYYQEGVKEIHGINLTAIQRYVAEIQKANPEFRHYNFIGDIHTHPTTPAELNPNEHPCMPSPGDIEDIIRSYKNGVLAPSNPFIFGIAGISQEGETVYSFYRLVKKDERYKVKEVD